jgi:hypothetical protein
VLDYELGVSRSVALDDDGWEDGAWYDSLLYSRGRVASRQGTGP